MGRAWRIVREAHAATAFDGEGARLYAGRWNSAGTRVVYTSGTKALATLENLVHLNPQVTFKWMVIAVEFDNALVEKITVRDLPADWTEQPSPASIQAIGDQWIHESRSAVLEVPSVIIQTESNFLLNPAHRDFKKIIIGSPGPFAFDSRLL